LIIVLKLINTKIKNKQP